jgi:uncharacterized membrane protein YfcA
VEPRAVVLAALWVVTVVFIGLWAALARSRDAQPTETKERGIPGFLEIALGFVTNFFDTLGIGSFAPTTSAFKLWKMVPDEKIPGTLNVGHALPTLAEALIFIAAVKVEPTTLIALIAASVFGAWIGAGIVPGLPRRTIQVGMGTALLVAAIFFAMKNLDLFPGGGEAFALVGWKLWAGVVGNFILGVLMMLGIGLYAPCMVLVSILGMHPIAAFPIMMGSCAFLMPTASIRFIQKRGYSQRAAVGLAIGGVPGVLVAAFIVQSLPLTVLRWGVVLVVLYTAMAMLRSATKAVSSAPEALAPEPGA